MSERASEPVATLHVVLPDSVDDAGRPSGGNTYDRRVIDGLVAGGWDVRRHLVPGRWPEPEDADVAALHAAIAAIPDGSVVLVDGLIGSAADQVLVPEANRLQLVLLVHMPLGTTPGAARDRERAVVECAAAVITTSSWTRDRLLDWYRAAADRVHVARPGVDPAPLSPGTSAGGELLSVAAVSAHKGHDVLVRALGAVADLPWHCRLVGSLDREPAFVAALRADIAARGLDMRIEFAGPRVGAELEECYATADLLVLASRGETYGMVLAEALAHGVPVLASDVGGVREALGPDRRRPPGLLVPSGDPAALVAALRRWLTDARLRAELRSGAVERRDRLTGWDVTAREVAAALAGLAGSR